MGLFGKKKDPIREREKDLVSEIRQLEDQIRALQGVLSTPNPEAPANPAAAPRSVVATKPASPEAGKGQGEMVFEAVDQGKLHGTGPNPFKEKNDPRTLQREGSTSLSERLMRYFRKPTSSNPKLVSYLAAGNIHGLQPLRYERRVARNRLLLWIAIIVVLIVGLLKTFLY